MGRRDLYLIYKEREERALAGYRLGYITVGECQYDACLAALARYPLERRDPDPPRFGRGRRRPLLRWRERGTAGVATHVEISRRGLLRPDWTDAAGCLAR
jgi:hypothetical protein